VGRNSVPEGCHPSQEFPLFSHVGRDIDETFAARNDVAEAENKDLIERLYHLRLLSRVGDGFNKILK